MATGLKKDPVLILRIDGEDLKEFLESTEFESVANDIFSQVESANTSLRSCLTMALERLTVDHGMPPSSDSLVYDSIVEPALQALSTHRVEEPVSRKAFLEEFKKCVGSVVQCLQENPVIVAHSENNYDGSGIRRLLSNIFELDKLLDVVWRDLLEDRSQKTSKEVLLFALDAVAESADLPPNGVVHQVDSVINEVIGTLNIEEEKILQEEDFKKTLVEILNRIMSWLEGNPIFVSSDSVVHDPLASSSTLLAPTSSPLISASE